MPSPTATTRAVTDADAAAVSALHDHVFGPGRYARTAYRVRQATPFASPFCRLASEGDRLVASLRLTPVTIGGAAGALLLGPLAVDPDFADQGYGRRLIGESLALAAAAGYRLVVLVGNLAYYGRLSFAAVPEGQLRLPGPVDPERILAHELVPGALAGYHGLIAAAPRPPAGRP